MNMSKLPQKNYNLFNQLSDTSILWVEWLSYLGIKIPSDFIFCFIISFGIRRLIILPKNNDLTNPIIKECHENSLNSGERTTLNILRQKFWPIDVLSIIKTIVKFCIHCLRARPRLIFYKMGDRPSVTVTKSLCCRSPWFTW